jgi:hypothetical protein
METVMRFRGKVAFWWYALLVVMLGVAIALGVLCATSTEIGTTHFALLLATTIIIAILDLFTIDTCVRNYIELYEDHLLVRVSVFRESVNYAQIHQVKETNSAWASLSTSLDRLEICYKKIQQCPDCRKRQRSLPGRTAKTYPRYSNYQCFPKQNTFMIQPANQ